MSNWDHTRVAASIEAYWNNEPFESGLCQWLAKAVSETTKPGSFLEAGCGTGRIYAAVKGLPQVVSYVGVDSSKEMLAIAAQKHPEGKWLLKELLALEPDSADTVLCFEVLGHIRGDVVDELKALILAARDTLLVSVWVGSTASDSQEEHCGVVFPRITRTDAGFRAAIQRAVPDCRVVERRQFAEMNCYVIRRH